MTTEQAIANASRSESFGHLGIYGDYEYYERNGYIVEAPLWNAMSIEGYRNGRVRARSHAWESLRNRLEEAVTKGEI